ncbi:MAG TPA: hypothetical protein HA362_02615 [Nanoarchaeota archaeon]|nr:hypothetical protein [Nanoarchaeota archaeon]
MGKERKNPIGIIKNYVIKKAGILDFGGMFALISEWAGQYHYDCIEKKHSEKAGATGTYIESNWYLERKVSYYVKFIIEIEFLVRDMAPVVVETHDGRKLKRDKGRVEVIFNSRMQKNYLKNFSSRPGEFSDFIRVIYEKYIAKQRLKAYEDKLEDESKDFIEEIRERLD